MATKKKSDKKKVKPVNNSKPVVKRGRPPVWIYSDELADEICLAIATSEQGLDDIIKNANGKFPSDTVIYDWLLDHPYFEKKYTRAREIQADLHVNEIIKIADDKSNDTIRIVVDGVEKEIENREWTSRSKLRIDARKWKASKQYPKKYGDKVETQHSGEVTVKQITGMKID